MTDHTLKVRLTFEQLALLDAEARAKGRTRSQHIRELLRENCPSYEFSANASGKVRAT